jgi:formate dehydrogenase accessory protein FdhE
MPTPKGRKGRWGPRIERARKLSADYPFAAEILQFYIRILSFQKDQYARIESVCGTTRKARLGASLRNELDLMLLLPSFPSFLNLLKQNAPAPLAAAARELSIQGTQASAELLTSWWSQPLGSAKATGETNAGFFQNEGQRFCARVFLEPYAEYLAEYTDPPLIEVTPSVCPLCESRPQLGVLRPQGEGATRSLICSLCATEWRFGRILCPACGESNEIHLAVYIAEEWPHVRVEACETCHSYIKTVDLSKCGHAVPVVDEITAIPLDLWARDKGYTKLHANFLGI